MTNWILQEGLGEDQAGLLATTRQRGPGVAVFERDSTGLLPVAQKGRQATKMPVEHYNQVAASIFAQGPVTAAMRQPFDGRMLRNRFWWS